MTPRPWIARANVWLVLALLAFVCVEFAGRRYTAVMPVQWQVERVAIDYPFRVVPDSDLGFVMPPNQHETIRTRDYTFLFETDAEGYPNRPSWPPKPSLVFLGDSLITGVGVGLEASITFLIAKMLPRQSIVNLGLPGAGPERQARIYRRYGGGWQPEFVVACLFLASDIENDDHYLSWLRHGQGIDYDTYRLRLARAEHRRGLFDRLLDKSLVLDHAVQVLRRWNQDVDYVEKSFRFADGGETLFGRYALQFVTTPAAADDPRLDPFVDSMQRLRALVEDGNTQLLVVLIPSKEEVFGPRTQGNFTARAKARLEALSLPTLDLYPALQRRGASSAPYFTRDIHLNGYGNRIVAEEFVAWFERVRRISPRHAWLEGSRPLQTTSENEHQLGTGAAARRSAR